MSWSDERADLLDEMLDTELFGSELTFNGITYPCIGPPQEQVKQMQQGPYEMTRPAQFSMRRADFNSSRISNRSVLTFSGLKFEVYSIIDDPKEAGVDLTANLKQ